MEEVWKDIQGYEGLYQVSNLGRIKSFRKKGTCTIRERVLKLETTNSGYIKIHLSKNGKVTNYWVHRIVAETFIPNPDKKTEVNHKNGTKNENHVWNLEWNTKHENMKHAYKTGLCDSCIQSVKIRLKKNKIRAKNVNQYDLEGNYIKTYKGSVEAQKELNSKGIKVNARNIRNVCEGKRNKAGGYVWRYDDGFIQ